MGIFYSVDNVKKVNKYFKSNISKKIHHKDRKVKLNALGWFVVIITFILIFLASSLLLGVIIGVVGFGIATKLGDFKNS